ncbi:MAG: AraC family transcriptional regulator [Gemmiger sp.]|nr:AraC family transcriptional regulator [Gemmiger sp.]
MIFDCTTCLAPAGTRELQGDAPVALGAGLWCGLLSSGQCLLEGAGGTQAVGHSGDLCLGQGPFTLRPVTPCHLLAICLVGVVADAFAAGLPQPRFADSAACPAAAELLARLCDGSRQGADASQTAYALLCELAHADEAAPPLSPLVAEAVQAIRDNYMGLYGVEELSEQLGVSKCHLIRAFTAELGVSPGRYLTMTRIEAAKLLLAEREYGLDIIARLCGFSGANYLCRVFKKETGLTPAAWREGAAPHPSRRLRQGEMFL